MPSDDKQDFNLLTFQDLQGTESHKGKLRTKGQSAVTFGELR